MVDLSLIAFSSRPAALRPRVATGSLGSRDDSAGHGTLALARTARLPSVLADTVGSLDCRFRSSLPSQYTPVQRFKCGLTVVLAWLGASMVRYSFPV